MKSFLILSLVFGLSTTVVTSQTRIKPTTPISSKQAAPVKTTSTAPTLSTSERALIDEINLARANPTAYITYLEQYRAYYKGKTVNFPNGQSQPTVEGLSALNDAISFLRTLKPLPALELRPGLVSGAKLHLDDMLKTRTSGHRGSDGSKPEDRLNRFGMWDISVGENIVYETRQVRNDVIGMIIDDGVSNRGHRRNIFSTQHRVVGIAGGDPTPGKTMYVLTFAGSFSERPASTKPTAVQY